ncbi:MAG TPA: hypothetical protein VLK85_19160 [Ramlibacter sp.]|nr:hypothetical protein [Ramlibacter sp.]
MHDAVSVARPPLGRVAARRPESRLSFPCAKNSIVVCARAAIRQHRLPIPTYDCQHEPAADEGLQEYLETKPMLGWQGVPA